MKFRGPLLRAGSVAFLLIFSAVALSLGNSLSAEAAWPPCTNLPLGSPTASGNNGNLPSGAIDGNSNTLWGSNSKGSWLRVDLGSRHVICTTSIAWYMGGERQYNFVISLSPDGVYYTDVYSGRSSGTTASLEEYDFFIHNARYVRITVNGNSQNDFAGIVDLRVAGYKNTDVTAPSVSITAPSGGSSVPGSLLVRGTTADNAGGSGVKVVWVKLDNNIYTTATPGSANNWSQWSAAFNIPSAGTHTVTATVIDNAGNQQWATVRFTVSSASRSTASLYDDFSGGAYTLKDGQRSPNGLWVNAYNGWGTSGVRVDGSNGDSAMYMYPTTATQPSSTHANLVLTTKSYKNFNLSLDMKTERQLRQNSSPNSWETAWIIFRYTDYSHHYYMLLRTNGIELGKKDGNSEVQTILYQAYQPRVAMGYYQHIDLQVSGNHITVYVDGAKAIDFYDSGVSAQLGGAGAIGLYDEDSIVYFDNIRIEPT